MTLKAFLQSLLKEKGGVLPEDIESYVQGPFRDLLLQSETPQEAFGVTEQEMEAFYKEGLTAYEARNLPLACEVFHWLAFFNPFRKRTWLGLGASYQLSKEWLKALHAYAVASLLDLEDPTPHYYAYGCYDALGDLFERERALQLAAEKVYGRAEYAPLAESIANLQRGRYGT